MGNRRRLQGLASGQKKKRKTRRLNRLKTPINRTHAQGRLNDKLTL
jgi:hypothetical protein